MKTIKIILLLLMVLITAVCKREITVETVINPDGSLVRSISTENDTTEVPETTYPFPPADDWRINMNKQVKIDTIFHESKIDTIKPDTSYIITATKIYASVTELNQDINIETDSIWINSMVQWEKSFRWFYSFYSYKETIESIFPFKTIPLEEKFTEQEIAWIKAGNDTADIDDRLDEWIMQSIFTEFFQAFQSCMREKPQYPRSGIAREAKRDSLYRRVMQYEFLDDAKDSFSEYFIKQVNDIYGVPVPDLKPILAPLEIKLDRFFATAVSGTHEEYIFRVQIPGQIYDANADQLKNGYAQWTFTNGRLIPCNMVIWVKSRSLNAIPLILSILIIGGSIIILIRLRRSP